MSDEAQGGRVFFSSTGRSLDGEDEIVVLSVGVDIGSSTSHLVFSRIVLERLDSRYVVTKRETFHESDILLTPYSAGETIDADALGAFIEQQYTDAKIDPDEIDTGALILTGVAVRRSNARAIGELFARQAGKMVAVSRRRQPGDRDGRLRLGRGGALDPRQRDGDECRHRRRHLEDRGLRRRQGRSTSPRSTSARGSSASTTTARSSASRKPAAASPPSSASSSSSARRCRRSRRARSPRAWPTGCSRRCRAARRRSTARACCRLDPLAQRGTDRPRSRSPAACRNTSTAARRRPSAISARCWRRKSARRVDGWGPTLEPSNEGIRATVIGASQYTTQVSGSTIFVVADGGAAAAQRAGDRADAGARRRGHRSAPRWPRAIKGVLQRLDLGDGDSPVAVFVPWRGSATFQRLDAFCKGAVDGLADVLAQGPSGRARRRRRRRRPARHPPARGDEDRQRRSSRSTGSSSRISTTSTSAPCCRRRARCRW